MNTWHGKSAVTYFIAGLGQVYTVLAVELQSITSDSSNNIYAAGILYSISPTPPTPPSVTKALVIKFNQAGEIQWQRTLGPGTTTDGEVFRSVVLDSTGNIYCCGRTSAQTTDSAVLIVKYDSTGAILWQRSLGSGVSGESATGAVIDVDSANNVYIAGEAPANVAGTNSTSGFGLLVKYNSAGVLQWQMQLGKSGNNSNILAMKIDRLTDSVYVCGYSDVFTGGSASHPWVAKYNSAGVLQWQRKYGGTFTTPYNSGMMQDLGLDSAGNLYAGGYYFNSSINNGKDFGILLKYNSAGVLQWQKSITAATQYDLYKVYVSPGGNVTVAGSLINDTITDSTVIITTHDTSGVLIDQRQYGGTDWDNPGGITADSNGNFTIITYNGGQVHTMFKIPANLSKTGSSATLTNGTAPYTVTYNTTTSMSGATLATAETAANLLSSSITLTSATRTLTPATPSIVYQKFTI